MAKGDKYLPLRRYLEVKDVPYIQLSYSYIEQIIGFFVTKIRIQKLGIVVK